MGGKGEGKKGGSSSSGSSGSSGSSSSGSSAESVANNNARESNNNVRDGSVSPRLKYGTTGRHHHAGGPPRTLNKSVLREADGALELMRQKKKIADALRFQPAGHAGIRKYEDLRSDLEYQDLIGNHISIVTY
jgi:hypothetical protein